MTKAVFRETTETEERAMVSLGSASFFPGTFDKRFARNLAAQVAERKISDKQAALMWKLVYRYRRSVTDPALVTEAKRLESTWPKP